MPEASTPDGGCVGIVLAGGQSRRMRRDKALLEYRGSTLLRHQIVILAQVCDQVMVSGDFPDYDCLHDIRPGMGPLGGIHAAAKQFDKQALLFLPVDMPAMTPEMLRKLLAHGGPCHFKAQPLPCFSPMSAKVVGCIESLWASEAMKKSVNDLHRVLGSQIIEFSDPAKLENINTPSHWRRFSSYSEFI